MNYLIGNKCFFAIAEKIKDGYELDLEQEKNLFFIISINNTRAEDFERIVSSDLPPKYIYSALFKNIDSANINQSLRLALEGKQGPLTTEFIKNQDRQTLATEFAKYWVESTEIMFEDYTEDESLTAILKKFNQVSKFKELISHMPVESRKLIADLSKEIMKTRAYRKIETRELSEKINECIALADETSQPKQEMANIDDVTKKLQDENETKVLKELHEVSKEFESITKDSNLIDMIKKESLLRLHNKYLMDSLKQYLKIDKSMRSITIGNEGKNAREIICDTIMDVREVFDKTLQQINEEKVGSLATRKEYLAQLKEQW